VGVVAVSLFSCAVTEGNDERIVSVPITKDKKTVANSI